MAKFFALGKWNSIFNIFWYHIIAKFLLEYLLDSFFPKKTSLLDKNPFPPRILVQEAFNYLGTFIGSLFLIKYEVSQVKKNNINSIQSNEHSYSLFLKESNPRTPSSEIVFIYNDFEGNIFQLQNIIIVILLFFSIQIKNAFFTFNLRGLDFWIPEIFFVCFITHKMFGMPIYLHKKAAIYFVLTFCTIFKALSLIYRFVDDDENSLYKEYLWIIPIGILIFISITLLRAYTFCKIKSFFDFKFLLSSKFLALYSIIGAILCFIFGLIASLNPCVEKKTFKNINLICTIKDKKIENFRYYYDSYSIFFKTLWVTERKIWINIGFVVIFIIKIILSFAVKIYLMLILQKLNPEYLICSNSIYYFITDIIVFIIYYISLSQEFKIYKFFGIIAQLFSVFGTIVYLELIELNFCNLNHDLKRNIRDRAEKDINENENEEARISELEMN